MSLLTQRLELSVWLFSLALFGALGVGAVVAHRWTFLRWRATFDKYREDNRVLLRTIQDVDAAQRAAANRL